MSNTLRFIYLNIILAVFFSASAAAQTVILSWNASPTAETTGYKIHYQAEPYVLNQWDGTGATQGNSPIDVGNVLTYQLTNLTDGVVYYFAVTAYDASANESTYSNIVHSNPTGDSYLHIGGHGMRFWQASDGAENRGSARF